MASPGTFERRDPAERFSSATFVQDYAGALDELRQAAILDTRTIERNATAYLATEVLDLITFAEHKLASTRFDTRTSGPVRPVPARPQN